VAELDVVCCRDAFVYEEVLLLVSCSDFMVCNCVYEIVLLPEQCLLVYTDVGLCFEQCVCFPSRRGRGTVRPKLVAR
jgi:hypothetical protein